MKLHLLLGKKDLVDDIELDKGRMHMLPLAIQHGVKVLAMATSSSGAASPEPAAFNELESLSPVIEPMAHVWLRAAKARGGLLPCRGKLGLVDELVEHVLQQHCATCRQLACGLVIAAAASGQPVDQWRTICATQALASSG